MDGDPTPAQRRILEKSTRMSLLGVDDIGTVLEIMSGGDAGYKAILEGILSHPAADDIMTILEMDDMNIRGSDIFLAHEVAGGNALKLVILLKQRSPELVEAINSHPDKIPGEPVVCRGASEVRGGQSNPYRRFP